MKAIHTEAPATEKNGQAEKTAGTTPDRAAAQGAESKAGSATTAAVAEPKKTAPVAAQAPVGRVTAIGDSVMLGAAPALSEALPTLDVMDAEVGTQVSTGIEILRARRAAGQLGEVVVVHLGNNGTFTPEQFDEMMGVLEGTQRVVFVNVKVPRPWEGPNNAAIDDGVRRHPNAVLVDWRAASIDRPGLFWDDGMHLRPEGQRAYADLVEANLHPPAETAATKETTPASP